MDQEFVQIRPTELRFLAEPKKDIFCSIQLISNSEEYIAFKVKTTSPKKYIVSPSTGIILPKSSAKFNVTMRAQQAFPPDMKCRDKFLVQCARVPSGFTEHEISPNLFSRESGSCMQENKLQVVLVSSSCSPVSLPSNDKSSFKKKSTSGDILTPKSILKSEVSHRNSFQQKMSSDPGENFSPSSLVDKSSTNVKARINQLQSKLNDLEFMLNQAEKNMTKLNEDNQSVKMRHLVIARRKACVNVQEGFPFLFVCFISIASFYLGFILHG